MRIKARENIISTAKAKAKAEADSPAIMAIKAIYLDLDRHERQERRSCQLNLLLSRGVEIFEVT